MDAQTINAQRAAGKVISFSALAKHHHFVFANGEHAGDVFEKVGQKSAVRCDVTRPALRVRNIRWYTGILFYQEQAA